MPTLRQLEYLVAIADLQHFGRAADACHVAQPTLSQQVRALEERLGVILVERRSSGVDLTPVGREVAARARRIMVQVKDLRDFAHRTQDILAGTLRFGVTPTLGPYLMPPIIASLHREMPDLKLHMSEGIPDDQARALSRGQLDMVVGPLPIHGSDLEVQPLFREKLCIVAASDHPLARAPSLHLDDLRGAGVLALDPRHHLGRQVAEICAFHGMEVLRDYEGTGLDSVHQMAVSSLGLAVLPELYVQSEVRDSPGAKVLEPINWNQFRSIAAAWRSGAGYADTYRAIADRIATAARELITTAS